MELEVLVTGFQSRNVSASPDDQWEKVTQESQDETVWACVCPWHSVLGGGGCGRTAHSVWACSLQPFPSTRQWRQALNTLERADHILSPDGTLTGVPRLIHWPIRIHLTKPSGKTGTYDSPYQLWHIWSYTVMDVSLHYSLSKAPNFPYSSWADRKPENTELSGGSISQ